MARSSETGKCPCGGGDYVACCGRFIDQGGIAQTAEELMRSRYTAYTLGNEAYVRATWCPRTLPEGTLVSNEPGLKWLGLEVRRHAQSGDEATVEFVARYKIGGRAQRMHEVSRFIREEGRWYYLDGSFPSGD
jgi:SEC-C motif-containing protein